MRRGWIAVLAAGGGFGLFLSSGAPSQESPRLLPRPPFAYFHAKGAPKPKTRLRLIKSSERRNQITDEQAWLKRHGLSLPTYGTDLPNNHRGRLPEDARASVEGQPLVAAIEGRQHAFLLYGPDYSGGRYLIGFDPLTKQDDYALDFRNYLKPQAGPAAEREFVNEKLQWAQEADGLLYVANYHRTYAKSSGGRNGYITALEPKTGRLRWRSRPLVCNSRNFLISGDAILTGYGFTAEPDYLYVLDRTNGAVAQAVCVKSGPDMLFVKDGKLFVRCYDTDYVFGLRR